MKFVAPDGTTVDSTSGSTLFIAENEFDSLATVYQGASVKGDQLLEVPENWQDGVLAVCPTCSATTPSSRSGDGLNLVGWRGQGDSTIKAYDLVSLNGGRRRPGTSCNGRTSSVSEDGTNFGSRGEPGLSPTTIPVVNIESFTPEQSPHDHCGKASREARSHRDDCA